jgi:hypothetical protein
MNFALVLLFNPRWFLQCQLDSMCFLILVIYVQMTYKTTSRLLCDLSVKKNLLSLFVFSLCPNSVVKMGRGIFFPSGIRTICEISPYPRKGACMRRNWAEHRISVCLLWAEHRKLAMSAPTSKVNASVELLLIMANNYKLWSCGAYHYKFPPKLVNRFTVAGSGHTVRWSLTPSFFLFNAESISRDRSYVWQIGCRLTDRRNPGSSPSRNISVQTGIVVYWAFHPTHITDSWPRVQRPEQECDHWQKAPRL